MNNLICYKTMPEWDASTLPKGFRQQHNTKIGTWAKLSIFAGKLEYYALDEDGNVLESFTFDKDSDIPFVEPQAWHKVEPLTDDLRCQLSFYCQPTDYFSKKYKLTRPHSEVVELVESIDLSDIELSNKELNVLDLGCGSGRNTLYLHQQFGKQQEFSVTAFDKSPTAIEKLQHIIYAEQLEKTTVFVADASKVDLDKNYDLIISTVVLMFLDAEQVPKVIYNIQQHTKIGGYNLIVCVIDSTDYPLSNHDLPFGFGFKPNELAGYYTGENANDDQNWKMIKYNEDVGHLHRKDAHGNPIALRFATMLAQKMG